LSALRRICRRGRVDAILLTQADNVRYFSGFTGEDSLLLVGRRWVRLLTDGRFTEQARIDCPQIEAIIRDGRMSAAVKAALTGRAVRRLGIEGYSMTVALRAQLARALPKLRLKAFKREVAALRQRKQPAELRAIRRAIRVAEGAFADLLSGGRRAFVGRTEAEIATMLEYRMRLRGSERAAFETIVAAGAHSAMPHYRPGPTRIGRGEFVLIDWGAVVDGYCSDLTRMVFTGRIPPQIGRVYEIVRRAQAAGIRAIGPGASCSSADAAAREVIVRGGHADGLSHGLGHGLGLAVHEDPSLGRKSPQRLRAGMVVTVEPGVYLPGVGGVRIEDDVLVTGAGRQRLSRLSRLLADAVLA